MSEVAHIREDQTALTGWGREPLSPADQEALGALQAEVDARLKALKTSPPVGRLVIHDGVAVDPEAFRQMRADGQDMSAGTYGNGRRA